MHIRGAGRKGKRRRLEGGKWQVAGAGNVQVDGASRHDRRWGVGANRERYMMMNGYGWWGVRVEYKKELSRKTV